MKKYIVAYRDRKFIVYAYDEIAAVKKIKKSIKDTDGLIKGILFTTDKKLAVPKFTDLTGSGLCKLDDNKYIAFWDNGAMHQTIEHNIENNYGIKLGDVKHFATSLDENMKLDMYDLNNLGSYNIYKPEIIKKSISALRRR